jgi:peptidoglycan/xylan/chitin deacetylase (PgdA/CDA1 family)
LLPTAINENYNFQYAFVDGGVTVLKQGAVVISLDTELEWGFHGFDIDHHLSTDGTRERENIRRLLRLFDRNNAPITWAIVGHLFLETCDSQHADLIRPAYPEMSGDWYADDPGTDVTDSPLRYGRDIINAVLDASVEHEIGTHTFSHILCGRKGCTEEVVRAELDVCTTLAEEADCDITSLVFPRNEIDHLETVAESGISVYRGQSAEALLKEHSFAGPYRKRARFILQRQPSVVTPTEVLPGLWNLPTSQSLHQNPHPEWNELFTTHPRVKRAEKAIQRAKRSNKIFHLWTHPHNFDDTMFRDLTQILEYAHQLGVPVLTMRDAVRQQQEVEFGRP